MQFEVLDTPAKGIVTVRLVQGQDNFRPCATGPQGDLKLTKLKAEMEALEVEASSSLPASTIATAVHSDKKVAEKNAIKEAYERSYVKYWWQYGALELSPMSSKKSQEIIQSYQLGPEFSLSVGTIASFKGLGQLCITIILNKASYPYAVIGTALERSQAKAINKSIVEALQSWTGSIYLRDHKLPTPHWDYEEILKRQQGLLLSKTISSAPNQPTIDLSKYITIKVNNLDPNYLAYAYINDPYLTIDDIIKNISGVRKVVSHTAFQY